METTFTSTWVRASRLLHNFPQYIFFTLFSLQIFQMEYIFVSVGYFLQWYNWYSTLKDMRWNNHVILSYLLCLSYAHQSVTHMNRWCVQLWKSKLNLRGNVQSSVKWSVGGISFCLKYICWQHGLKTFEYICLYKNLSIKQTEIIHLYIQKPITWAVQSPNIEGLSLEFSRGGEYWDRLQFSKKFRLSSLSKTIEVDGCRNWN